MVPWYWFSDVAVIVAVPICPIGIVIDDGVDDSEKSGVVTV
jgi:hypothetical protein